MSMRVERNSPPQMKIAMQHNSWCKKTSSIVQLVVLENIEMSTEIVPA